MSGNERVSVPGYLLHPRGGDHYVLKVVGDSMDDEGIFDGDYVIILRRESAESGEMVIAQVGDNPTIKRYFVEGGKVKLQPGNKRLEPLTFDQSEVEIKGVVVGIMRRC